MVEYFLIALVVAVFTAGPNFFESLAAYFTPAFHHGGHLREVVFMALGALLAGLVWPLWVPIWVGAQIELFILSRRKK